MGVPAISVYDHIGEAPVDRLRDLTFWPLFAGHAHIDVFPRTHSGVTLLREPRSRVLSHYRQVQRAGQYDWHDLRPTVAARRPLAAAEARSPVLTAIRAATGARDRLAAGIDIAAIPASAGEWAARVLGRA